MLNPTSASVESTAQAIFTIDVGLKVESVSFVVVVVGVVPACILDGEKLGVVASS